MKYNYTHKDVEEFRKECNKVMADRRRLRKYTSLWVGCLLALFAVMIVLNESGVIEFIYPQ